MDNSPVTHSAMLKWPRCPLPVPPRLCSLITSLQNGFKRLQMEEQWHLSLANEGPAVPSKGELHAVMLIAGYFSADFIPGVSGKMSSLCSGLLLQRWSGSPGVDLEPPKSPWDCFNLHTSPERAEFHRCSSISPLGIVFPDVWPFSDQTFIVFVPPTTVLGQPVRLRFDLNQTKFWLQSFSKNDKTAWNQSIVGERGQNQCWEPVSAAQ